MPIRLKNKVYYPVERRGKKEDYSTFRYKRSGKAYLLFGKLKHGGVWALYEILEPR